MKHTEGPWASDTKIKNSLSVCYSEINGSIVASIYCDYDANLISQAPAMRDYMIKRAEVLENELKYADSIADHFELIGFTEPEKREELTRIIEIIKAAGVEVVE